MDINKNVSIIETHTRPGGDRIPLLVKLVTGIDQFELAAKSALQSLKLPKYKPKYRYAAVRFLQWKPGEITGISGLDECLNFPGVIEVSIRAKKGDILQSWKESYNRPGYVVVGADNIEKLETTLCKISDTIKVTQRNVS